MSLTLQIIETAVKTSGYKVAISYRGRDGVWCVTAYRGAEIPRFITGKTLDEAIGKAWDKVFGCTEV